MGHLPDLISDLALILGAAAISTLIFKRLKQPLVLGYIIAGFLVGPYFNFIPTVVDKENIETLAEIGVIFLLFSLGLEFSFKKLIRVGGSASITALVEIVFITVAGFFLGQLMGWSTMDSLFLGGMLASSSTTIILRAFDELGLKTKAFAGIVFGVLIVEDIVVILLMVLLSTVAVTRVFQGAEMLLTILELMFFLVLWFTSGIFVLPTLLKKAQRIMTDEILLILSLALCLGMVVLATVVGFSAELGAFVMGSIIAETTSAEKIEHLLKPVKDLFGAIFFTSVGMMIDPANMVTYATPVLFVTLLTLFGKLFSTTLGAVISGQPLKQSIQVGMSMAQIGEFAFIVATLGLSLGVTSAFLFPVAVGASAITTFTTPYLIKLSGPLYHWLEKVIPAGVIRRINKYSTETKTVTHTSEWRKFIRSTVINGVLMSIIIIAIIVFSSQYVEPWINKNGNSLLLKAGACLLTLLILSPFLWALAIRTPAGAYKTMKEDLHFRRIFFVVQLIRLALVAFFVGFLLHRFFNLYTGIVFTGVTLFLLIAFSKKIQALYGKLERRFVSNLNERETEHSRLNRTELAPWDAHIVPVTVPARAACVGKTLNELKWREMIGVNVVMIKRDDHQIAVPGREQIVYPNDVLLVLGTDHQIQRLSVLIRAEPELDSQGIGDVALYNYYISETNILKGKTIRHSGLREQANALVVGIERKNDRILNPESDTVLEANDNLFIVGDPKRIKELLA
ncbi:cation:proton antiporter [Niastella sp. OAS944]|uniref:cation:proton antiporter domain-containing protein n=1 Tax=Niastella sp. OAS944 TaxID=2664089 RepID=UPI0034879C3B|nr:CPA2 family monovalent cation:H+ antiporter-2 [Chitinophagaceae bacterium OAS944]